MENKFLIMHRDDNVAVSLVHLKPGDSVEVPGGPLPIREDIPVGHKFTLCAVPLGHYIVKYGEHIGRTKVHLPPGSLAHVRNMEDITEEVYLSERMKLGL